jgi:hypothetical protein
VRLIAAFDGSAISSGSRSGASETSATGDERAQDDDVLDAALDEDGMDATGL